MTNSGEPNEGLVTVTGTGPGSFVQRIRAGAHELTADEPQPTGTDTGASPYDLLLAALGSCTSMTLQMYADRKKWPLEKVSVSLRHDRIHATDCANCETEAGMVSQITRVIRLEGPLDEEQRTRLLQIADRCPVHRTLSGEIDIQTEMDAAKPH
ncbi:OsmC family protein [Stackebrandtia nassauensis]|uniref:OsmC family protein n=1 Tax=Stackebrandtia nassauensis (strain DSM 44728 / CIP 108903 / NRRL B-16338 / NBRC 102104 / LLR-40K-21) TaxID=446470 RepID=D3Q7R9_STANL|nr:OsmC family protein [Stackebrandtia nassauensis]ADD44411.1 OsmC family protein [Stackebrandtia nassauensis DSM 44728]